MIVSVVPYEFEEAKFIHSNLKGYWVTFYILFDGKTFHHFAHQSDAIDNALLAREAGVYVTQFFQRIFVSPYAHSDIFNEIEDYVHRSHFDR